MTNDYEIQYIWNIAENKNNSESEKTSVWGTSHFDNIINLQQLEEAYELTNNYLKAKEEKRILVVGHSKGSTNIQILFQKKCKNESEIDDLEQEILDTASAVKKHLISKGYAFI